jgi:hypothetical protein
MIIDADSSDSGYIILISFQIKSKYRILTRARAIYPLCAIIVAPCLHKTTSMPISCRILWQNHLSIEKASPQPAAAEEEGRPASGRPGGGAAAPSATPRRNICRREEAACELGVGVECERRCRVGTAWERHRRVEGGGRGQERGSLRESVRKEGPRVYL